MKSSRTLLSISLIFLHFQVFGISGEKANADTKNAGQTDAESARIEGERRPVLQDLSTYKREEDRVFGSLLPKKEIVQEEKFWTWPVISGVSLGAVAVVTASVIGALYMPRKQSATLHVHMPGN